jgi:hypothetical protein
MNVNGTGPIAVKKPIANKREVRPAVGEGDELAVEDPARGEIGEFGQQLCHVPATARADPEAAVAPDDRPESIPFELEGVVAAR